MNSEYNSLQSQHKYVDENLRTTRGMDYDKIKREAMEMLEDRKKNNEINKGKYKLLREKSKNLYDSIKKCPEERLKEFEQVMLRMLGELVKVKNGEKTFLESREQLFERELAMKYVKPK